MGGELVQAWPPRRWRNCAVFNETTQQTQPAAQFEVWPTPARQGDDASVSPYSLRIEGNAPINALVEDTDICVIDATLIVLFAAAEILAQQKSESASLKLQKANQYRRMLIARLGAQQRNMRSLSKDGGHMGPLADGRRLTPYLDFIPAHNQIPGAESGGSPSADTISATRRLKPATTTMMNAVAANAQRSVQRRPQRQRPHSPTSCLVMLFPLGSHDGRCNYISNGADRNDVVTLMKEMIQRFEGQPEISGRA